MTESRENMSRLSKDVNDPFDITPFRESLRQLYVEEEKSLDEVIKILREKGCQASRNMFLKKIREWNIHKYNRYDQMIGLWEKVEHGEGVDFQVAGRTIPKTEVIRYFRRRKGQQPCRVKKSSKPVESSPERRFSPINLPATFIPTSPMASSLKLPESFQEPENLFHAISEAQSKHTSPSLDDKMAGSKPYPIDQHISDISFAANLLRRGLDQAGGALMERAFRGLATSMHEEDDYVLFKISHMSSRLVLQMLYFQLHGLAEIFTKYVYRLCYNSLGPNHVETRLTKALYDNRHSSLVIQTGVEVQADTVLKIAGKDNPQAVIVLSRKISALTMTTKPSSDIIQDYEGLTASCNKLPEKYRGLKTEMKRQYALYLAMNGKYSEGLAMMHEITSLIHQYISSSEMGLTTVIIRACYEEALCILKEPKFVGFEEDTVASQKRFCQVEQLLKFTVEKAIQILGPLSLQTLMAIENLAEVYRDHGYHQEAQFQMDYILEQLAEFRLS